MLPFQLTTDPATKFEPVTVRVNVDEPAIVDVGSTDVRTGIGLEIVNVKLFEVPPPGEGLFMVTVAVPAIVRYPAGTVAVSDVASTKVVVSGVPFQLTTDPETRFDPMAVSVNVEDSMRADVGVIDVKTGTGLVTVNVRPLEVPPPGVGLLTVMVAVPAGVRSPAGIAAVSCVALT